MVLFNVCNHPQHRHKWSCHFIDRKPRLKAVRPLSIQLELPFKKVLCNLPSIKHTDVRCCLMNFDKCIYCITTTQKGYSTFSSPRKGMGACPFPVKPQPLSDFNATEGCALNLSLTPNSRFHIPFFFSVTMAGL